MRLIRGRAQFSAAVLCAGALLVLFNWPDNGLGLQLTNIPSRTPPVVAVCISGVLRGEASVFASALREHFLDSVTAHGAKVHLFAWLQDESAERSLEAAFAAEGVITRKDQQLPQHLRLGEDEALDADSAGLLSAGEAWSNTGTLKNTRRMLRKIAGCEYLRQQQRTYGIVVRIRPDLILQDRLVLPDFQNVHEPIRTPPGNSA